MPASALCRKYQRRRGGQAPSMLVLHYTDMPLAAAFRRLTSARAPVSAHYLIERNGCVHYLVDERYAAWHAGASWWRGESGLNHAAIGIELDYAPQRSGRARVFPPFAPPQIARLIALSQAILTRHKIAPARVLGHSDIAPDRKQDPGPAFPWQRLARAGIGIWPAPGRVPAAPSLRRGQSGAAVRRLQEDLRAFGYGISAPPQGRARALKADGQFGRRTEELVRAFQLHFRARKADGVADAQTQSLLRRLLQSP